jgi:hypothetical protein
VAHKKKRNRLQKTKSSTKKCVCVCVCVCVFRKKRLEDLPLKFCHVLGDPRVPGNQRLSESSWSSLELL